MDDISRRARAVAVNVAVIGVIALILILGNTAYRQWSQYRKGEKALVAGDAIAAISGYEASIHMYLPGSPLMERCSERLWNIAEAFERQGDLDRALIAYRALRSSWYSTKWVVQPGNDWIARCDARIKPLAQILQARQRQ